MGAGLIAGLGSLAGGMLAKAIMPKPAELKTDTNIPGVANATVQKATKSNEAINVAQIDPGGAINFFKEGAIINERYIKQGLNLYNESINQAVQSINRGYAQGNATLQPVASVAVTTLNKQLQMLGINPISQTTSYGSLLSNIGDYPQLQSQLAAAEKLTDPVKRAAAKNAIIKSLNNINTLSTDIQSEIKLKARNIVGPPPTFNIPPWDKKTPWMPMSTREAIAKQQYNQQLAAYNQKLQTTTNGLLAAALDDQKKQLGEFSSQYQSNYDPNLGTAYSGKQVQDAIEATPGYKFQFDQGTQAVMRGAAATGSLASGNTMAALNQFGQKLADNYFQRYMDNLSNISSQGVSAVNNLATNQINKGKDLATLSTTVGSSNANAYSAMGQGYQNAYNNSGTSYYNAAQFNAAAQNEAMAAKRQQDATERNQAVASGPGYMNAQTAQNQLQYQIFQNQQGGQVFYQNPNTSAGAGQGWPSYNNSTRQWSV